MDGVGCELQSGWRARLELTFERRGERTDLARRRHTGPLGVQRPFHPEPEGGSCHVYVLHPPGGLVAGDSLELEVALQSGARALLTTPAAAKLYRGGRHEARQEQRFRLAPGARLEWLPQETIAYDGARAQLETRVELAEGATFVGMEVLCLGRPAVGERFVHGTLAQRLEIWRAREPLFVERAHYRGGAPALEAAFGMGGRPVTGALVCAGPALGAALRDELRAVVEEVAPGEAAVSVLASALVCRYRGESVERAQHALRRAWAVLRERCFGLPAIAPRIWST